MTIASSANIHPTAVIAEGAEIGADCVIGPYAVIGAEVRLDKNVELKSHAVVDGWTDIGEGTVIFPFASIGHIPQDMKFGGERTKLEIGARNRIREHATMNPGTTGGGGITKIGNDGLYMMSIHVGHDCIVGDRVILANNASLGGHCIVGDNVVVGALAGIHQFCRIGQGAMIGGLAAVVSDIIPFGTVMGPRAHLEGLNLTGLKRADIDRDLIKGLRAAYKDLFQEEGSLKTRAAQMEGDDNPLVQEMLSFVLGESSRSICTPLSD